MGDASLLPRRIVKETQRLLTEPGTHMVVTPQRFSHLMERTHNLTQRQLQHILRLVQSISLGPDSLLVLTLLSPFDHTAAPGISATPYTDNLRYFNVLIEGPNSSPYESMRIYFQDLRLTLSARLGFRGFTIHLCVSSQRAFSSWNFS